MPEKNAAGEDWKPHANFDDVGGLLERVYGLKLTDIKALDGYYDQNFHVMVEEAHNNPNIQSVSKSGYVLKILNVKYSKEEKDHLMAQNAMKGFARAGGIVCPLNVPDIGGNVFSDHQIPSETRTSSQLHTIRLTQYIEGDVLVSVIADPELIAAGGAFIAEFHSAIAEFGDERLRRDEHIWTMWNVNKLMPYVPAIEDRRQREMVDDVIERWPKVQAKLRGLPYGPIHNDFSANNLLVKMDNSKKYQITGILDFEESSYGYKVSDLAVYIAYSSVSFFNSMSPLTIGKYALKGYLSKRSLSVGELSVLRDCIIARVTQSLSVGAHSYSLNKDPYVLSTQKHGWQVLEKLRELPSDVHDYWMS